MLMTDELIRTGVKPAIKHHLTFEPEQCLAEAKHYVQHGNRQKLILAREYLNAHETVMREIMNRPDHSPASCLTCETALIVPPFPPGLLLVIPLIDLNCIPIMGGGICAACCTDQDRVKRLIAEQLDAMGLYEPEGVS